MIEHLHLNGVEISTYKVAKKGNWCSGDSFFILRTDDYILCALADGLGSGEEAMEASDAAMNVIKKHHAKDMTSLMDMCNEALWHKRGVVLSILKIDIVMKEITYSNIGNIGCIFYSPSGKLNRPAPSRGYLSGRKQMIRVQRIPYEKGMSFILYSDGLSFNPKYHLLFNTMNSSKETIEQIVDRMVISNDDTTIVVGKLVS